MYDREGYVWCKEHGICTQCRKAKARPNRNTCDDCAEKQSTRERKKRESEDRAPINARNKQRRERLKADGLCFRCGKHKPEQGKTMCTECAIKYRRWNREWHNKKSRHWKETGQCQWCSNKAIHGKNYCEKHYIDLCERIAKGREAREDKAMCKHLNNAFWMEYKRNNA